MTAEELGLEGQHEQSLQLQFAGHIQQPVDDRVPDPVSLDRGVDRHSANLAEVRPQHVQGPAPYDLLIDFGDPEFLDRFVECHEVLLQQDPSRVGVHQALDLGHVGSAGPTNQNLAAAGVNRRSPGRVVGHVRHTIGRY